jgi:electron transport complex protein RnfA
MMDDLFIIIFGAMFVNNFVLTRFLGLCPFIGVSKKLSHALGMGIAVIVVMIISSFFTHTLYKYLLHPYGIEYLEIVFFILVIASLVQILEIILKNYTKSLYSALGIYLPLITTNCAIMGVSFLNIRESFSLLESISNALGAGLGFMLALIIMAGIRERLEASVVPEFFKGVPLAFIVASFLSLTFTIFRGMV